MPIVAVGPQFTELDTAVRWPTGRSEAYWSYDLLFPRPQGSIVRFWHFCDMGNYMNEGRFDPEPDIGGSCNLGSILSAWPG